MRPRQTVAVTLRMLLMLPLLGLAGCTASNQYKPPPPPEVTVALPIRQSVTNYLEETGTTEAVERAEVRARVKGFLEEIHFQPNEIVEKGESLYTVEKQEYQAVVSAATAAVQSNEVELRKAKIEYDRQIELKSQDATAETKVVAAEANWEGAKAAVASAQAQLAEATIDLNYTDVTSPIAGRVDRTKVKVGNLVGGDEATHLTTVISYDPIYANFNISEQALLRLRSQTRSDRAGPETDQDLKELKDSIKLYLSRANDEGFPFEGHLDYWDLSVNQSSGTFALRGIFANPDLKILPGLFVRVRLPLETTEDALLVPELAVQSDQQGRYVLIVNSKDEVERRNIAVGSKVGSMIVISEGLAADDRVIVDGVQRARPGATVTPTETTLEAPKQQAVSIEKGSSPPPKPMAADGTPGETPPEATDADAAPVATPPAAATDSTPKS